MTKLLFQGHGSYRITANNGMVIYIDPFAGEGYDAPADIILVTHQHRDHNRIKIVTQKPKCQIITNRLAIGGAVYNKFSIADINIEPVEARNLMHSPKKCVGFIISLDGLKIYAAGDTSMTREMESFAARKLDYAVLPCDGFFNMGLREAAKCAAMIGAKHTIPVHMKPGKLFDRKRADKFNAPNKLVVEPGQEISL